MEHLFDILWVLFYGVITVGNLYYAIQAVVEGRTAWFALTGFLFMTLLIATVYYFFGLIGVISI